MILRRMRAMLEMLQDEVRPPVTSPPLSLSVTNTQPASAPDPAGTAGNPSDERLAVMGRIMGCEMLSGAGPERLVVLEMGGHGSFVRPPELCLPAFGRFVTERR